MLDIRIYPLPLICLESWIHTIRNVRGKFLVKEEQQILCELQGFPNSSKRCVVNSLSNLGGRGVTGWREPGEEWFWHFKPFSKLKTASVNTEDQLKSKLTWPKCPKCMKLKQKWNCKTQWLHLKMLFLLGYNLKSVI